MLGLGKIKRKKNIPAIRAGKKEGNACSLSLQGGGKERT
jgi:hypothetical protein